MPSRAPAPLARRTAAALACLALLVLGACPEDQPPDDLDPEVVADVARAGGDAEGDAWSGEYDLQSEPGACDCPTRMGFDLCALFDVFGATGRVTHAEGYLTLVSLSSASFGLSGAVDRDGSFELAAIYGLDSLLSSGSVYARMPGAFADERSFTGELRYRLLGELPGGPVDCRAAFSVAGQRLPGG